MKELILLIGPSGSGKSTWIKEHGLRPYVISADIIRQMLGFATYVERNGKTVPVIKDHDDTIVWRYFNKMLEDRVKYSDLTIVDNTNTTLMALDKMHEVAIKYHLQIKTINFVKPYLTNGTLKDVQTFLLNRNEKRDQYPVPKYVIKDQIKQYKDTMQIISKNEDSFAWLKPLSKTKLDRMSLKELLKTLKNQKKIKTVRLTLNRLIFSSQIAIWLFIRRAFAFLLKFILESVSLCLNLWKT